MVLALATRNELKKWTRTLRYPFLVPYAPTKGECDHMNEPRETIAFTGIPPQLKQGEWKVTVLYRTGRSATYRYAGYAKAWAAYYKRLWDARGYVAEVYLSCMTDMGGEQIFRGVEIPLHQLSAS